MWTRLARAPALALTYPALCWNPNRSSISEICLGFSLMTTSLHSTLQSKTIMSGLNLQEIHDFAIDLAKKAGKMILEGSNKRLSSNTTSTSEKKNCIGWFTFWVNFSCWSCNWNGSGSRGNGQRSNQNYLSWAQVMSLIIYLLKSGLLERRHIRQVNRAFSMTIRLG